MIKRHIQKHTRSKSMHTLSSVWSYNLYITIRKYKTKELPTKYLVFIYSLIVIIGYQLMSNTFHIFQLLLTILNAMLITMTAQGGYEWVFKPLEKKSGKSN